MEGYYIKESEENPDGVSSGKLNIEVANLQEFRNLLEQAEKEACQLKKTIDRLRWFNLEIEFTADTSVSKLEKSEPEKTIPQFSNDFMVVPDEKNLTLTIMPDAEGAVLRLSKERALVLASIIRESTQGW